MDQTNIYTQLEALPTNMTGQIINGRLIAMPRPAWPHCQAESVLSAGILTPIWHYFATVGTRWMWHSLFAPTSNIWHHYFGISNEMYFWFNDNPPCTHRCEVVPNWVCEIASPSTAKLDRIEKMPLYAKYGVSYLWLVDPLLKTLEVYTLRDERWLNIKNYKDDDAVSAVPFNEIVIQLSDLWIPDNIE